MAGAAELEAKGPVSDAPLQPILALLGHGLGGNPTQYMIEKAIVHHELDWRYLSLDVPPEQLEDAVRGMRAMGFRGGNCAGDYRTMVLPYLDRLSRVAELAGVVNCILSEEGALVGENTEGKAVLSALRRRIDPAGQRVVLLGAGRMARAIAVELALAQVAEITVVNCGEEAGGNLVQLISGELQTPAAFASWQDDYPVPPETRILIQATSAAVEDPDASLPLNLTEMAPETVLADVTANPPRTALVRAAQDRGCPVVDGLEILIEQAAINFKLWTGLEPNTDVMHDAVEEFLEL